MLTVSPIIQKAQEPEPPKPAPGNFITSRNVADIIAYLDIIASQMFTASKEKQNVQGKEYTLVNPIWLTEQANNLRAVRGELIKLVPNTPIEPLDVSDS